MNSKLASSSFYKSTKSFTLRWQQKKELKFTFSCCVVLHFFLLIGSFTFTLAWLFSHLLRFCSALASVPRLSVGSVHPSPRIGSLRIGAPRLLSLRRSQCEEARPKQKK
uniref:Transmembrane protein n=1 Tax=Pediastrum duplex TaxID=3105 RepID=A0A2U8GIT8_PEDDU|nr:hypothetical protein [Pediastrum duplex]